MHRTQLIIVGFLLLLLGLGSGLYLLVGNRPQSILPPPQTQFPDQATAPAPVAKVEAPPPPAPVTPLPIAPTEPPKPVIPASPVASAKPKTAAPASVPAAPVIKLHTELIPKDISIVRCYYTQEVVSPGTTFEFDVNGSGFTAEFQQMIKIDPGVPNLTIKNMQLVTANQIRAQMEVGPGAATGWVFPKVLIKGLPVFRAPDPFAVIRKNEVLTVLFTEMDKSGRAGKFRVLTNIDEATVPNFRIYASTPGIEISEQQALLPFAMDGKLTIGPAVQQGAYGLYVSIGGKEVFRKEELIHIVRPNLGRSGLTQRIMAIDRFRRPGDNTQFYVHGTGYSPEDVNGLTLQVDDAKVDSASFTFISPTQIQFSFDVPKNAVRKQYSVTVVGADGQVLRKDDNVFEVVSGEWMAGLQVVPPVAPGKTSTLRFLGRDFSDAYAKSLSITTDEPGITIGAVTRSEATVLTASITVAPTVTPGDYVLHITANGKPVKPNFGSLIKVVAE